jgi:hypothetical protein
MGCRDESERFSQLDEAGNLQFPAGGRFRQVGAEAKVKKSLGYYGGEA